MSDVALMWGRRKRVNGAKPPQWSHTNGFSAQGETGHTKLPFDSKCVLCRRETSEEINSLIST